MYCCLFEIQWNLWLLFPFDNGKAVFPQVLCYFNMPYYDCSALRFFCFLECFKDCRKLQQAGDGKHLQLDLQTYVYTIMV